MPLEDATLIELEADQDDQWVREYKAKFDIWVPRNEEPSTYSVIAAGNAPGLPVVGTSFNLDGNADNWAIWTPQVNVQIAPDADQGERVHFHVTMLASSKRSERQSDQPEEDPILEVPKIRTNFTRYQETIREWARAVGGGNETIVNTAGDPMDGVTRDASRPRVEVTFNSLNHNLDQIADYMDAVSSEPMWGMPADTVKLSEHSLERFRYTSASYYYTHTFGLEVRYDDLGGGATGTWETELLSRGYSKLDQANGGKKTPITEANTQLIVQEPQLLKADGDLWEVADGAAAVGKINGHKYRAKPLSNLGIPLTI